MPPPLALALCSIFVVFLLRLDRKQTPDVTRALWIPTIWMLYIASKPSRSLASIRNETLKPGSPLDQVFLTILMSAALIVLFRRGFDWAGAIRENTWLVLLIMFMLISVVWSDIPGISFKRWIKEFQAVLIAFVVLSEPSARRAMESILRRTTYVLIPFSLVLIKYFPIYGIEYGRWSGSRMWIGVTLQKNGLARLCIICGSLSYLVPAQEMERRQRFGLEVSDPYGNISFIINTLSLGRPSAESLLFRDCDLRVRHGHHCLQLGLFHDEIREKSGCRVLASVTSVIILFGVVSVFIGGTSIEFFASSAGRDATLTGRTEVWASLLPVVMESPLVRKRIRRFLDSENKGSIPNKRSS